MPLMPKQKTKTPKKTPLKTPTPNSKVPSLMSLQVEPPKFNYTFPRCLTDFHCHFNLNPLDVPEEEVNHFWHIIDTMQVMENCTNLLWSMCREWWKTMHARQENNHYEPMLTSFSAPQQPPPEEKENMPPPPPQPPKGQTWLDMVEK